MTAKQAAPLDLAQFDKQSESFTDSEQDCRMLLAECKRQRELLDASMTQFAALRDREQSIRNLNAVLVAALEMVMDHDGKLTGADWTTIRAALERNIKVMGGPS